MIRKIFTALVLTLFISGSSHAVQINPDAEIHMAVGGLYTLTAALALESHLSPEAGSLRKFFADVPVDWQESFKIQKAGDDIWVGISVAKFSTTKMFLRNSGKSLGISDSLGGTSWISGDFAWLKAGTVKNGKFVPIELQASYGSGKDSELLFFSTKTQDSWWQSSPVLTKKAEAQIMKLCGEQQNGLHKPAGVSQSIYDSVRPSAVKKPDDMHTSEEKKFSDKFDRDMGSIIFKPVPHVTGKQAD